MTCDEAQDVADQIEYKTWRPVVSTRQGLCFLRWEWEAPCVDTGVTQTWESREWLLAFPITEETVVRTAFAAAKMAELHECAENFLFQGRKPFDPHRSIL